MADPQGLISHPPSPRRTELLNQGTVWLLRLGLAIFIGSLGASLGLFLYQRSLGQTLASWGEQVKTQENELKPELLNQLLGLSRTASGVRELLQNHIYSSKLFRFLEEVTRPDVTFSSLHYSTDSRTVELAGLAASYGAVAQQLATLDGRPEVESVSFGGLSLAEKGRVNFKVAFIITPSLTR